MAGFQTKPISFNRFRRSADISFWISESTFVTVSSQIQSVTI